MYGNSLLLGVIYHIASLLRYGCRGSLLPGCHAGQRDRVGFDGKRLLSNYNRDTESLQSQSFGTI